MISEETLNKIKPGAKVRVTERVKEGDKERQSIFEGLVIARKHGNEPGASFTVRAIIHDVGVEKVYPIHSPMIAKLSILSAPRKVHRAKLYFVRELSHKQVREKLKTTA
jgi:large subunit ribosomal protein L19